MDPFQVCDILTSYVKSSCLNFSLIESPFGMTIQIKKSFIKMKNGSLKYPSCHTFSYQENGSLEEVEALRSVIDQLKIDHDILENTVEDLDTKLQQSKIEIGNLNSNKNAIVKAREAIEKDLKEKTTENSNLKESLKTLKEEKETKQKEVKSLTTVLISKDKELHNLTVKCDNLIENLSKCKNENSTLISERKKANKELKKARKSLTSFPLKSCSKGTNTSTYLEVTTSTTVSLCNISTDSLLHEDPNHNICKSLNNTPMPFMFTSPEVSEDASKPLVQFRFLFNHLAYYHLTKLNFLGL